MYKSILASLVVLFFQGMASAETVSCNAFLMKASINMEDENKSMYAEKLELKGKAGDILEATMRHGNIELAASTYKNDRSDIYELTYAVNDLKSGKREVMDQFLLLGTGPSKQNGWEGPAGSFNYEIVRSSLQPMAMAAFYTYSAYAKLSALGVKSRSLSNAYQDTAIIQKAVRDGVFKEGEVIGAGFLLNCFAM